MPSLGIGEILLVVIAVIIFIKPKDLPRFFSNLGKFYAEIQRGYAKFKYFTKETLHDISKSELEDTNRNQIANQDQQNLTKLDDDNSEV